MINTDLISILLNNIDNVEYCNLITKDFRREFRHYMPKKYYIFPTQPKIYILSNTKVCIEMPAWGSLAYRNKLCLLEEKLRRKFKMDTVFYDGKITYVIREDKVCNQK